VALAPSVAPVRLSQVSWALVVAAIGVQIAYPLIPESSRTAVTVTSVVVFFLAAVADVFRRYGASGAAALVAVAGGGGLLAESVGVATGWPFGSYNYTGTLGLEVLGVPAVVPLAWTMMAWPALVVARTLAARPVVVVLLGALALSAWDLFLDPQMVDAGHWTWHHPDPGLPLVPGIPLTNYLGWLLVSLILIAVLNLALPRQDGVSGPASTLYLWVYFSSTLGHLVFFGLPGSALVGGVLMGAIAIPFAVRLARRHYAE
jgi:uncharacterized membrane protein